MHNAQILGALLKSVDIEDNVISTPPWPGANMTDQPRYVRLDAYPCRIVFDS